MKIANPIARLGEDRATEYLCKQGFHILERNYSKRYGEIDIIAIEGDTLAFIEVKTRTSNNFGTPFEAITPWKMQNLEKTVQYYVSTHKNLPQNLRMDAVGVELDKDQNVTKIELIRNISGF